MTSKATLWMPLYPGDYLRDTTALSTEMHGAYFLLLLHYWVNGPPDDDDEQLAAITRLPLDRWKLMRPRLARFFQIGDGRWSQKRVEIELEKARRLSEQRRRAGKKGNESQGKGDALAVANANAAGDAAETHLRTPSPSPSPSPSPPAPHAGAPVGKEDAAREEVRASIAVLDAIKALLVGNPYALHWSAHDVTAWRRQGWTEDDILGGVRRALAGKPPEKIASIRTLSFFEGAISDAVNVVSFPTIPPKPTPTDWSAEIERAKAGIQ